MPLVYDVKEIKRSELFPVPMANPHLSIASPNSILIAQSS
jgi:hypothetical protein